MAISKKAKICGILSAVEIVVGIITIVVFPYLYDLILESVSKFFVQFSSTGFIVNPHIIDIYRKTCKIIVTSNTELV